MRPFTPVILAVAALAVFVTGGPLVQAENDEGMRFLHLLEPKPRAAPVPRAPSRPVAQPRAVVLAEPVVKPKLDPNAFVMVLGDSLAEMLAGGIDEAFGDNLDVAILRKTRADSGLVRADHFDWPKAVTELLASPERVTHVVMLLGANDRQPLREGDVSHEPLSPRWRELYMQRIDAVARTLAERRIPLVWVGAPPMRNERLSSDMIAINDLLRERVQANGGVYVDLWEPFVDSENRFTVTGPDINGQPTRLRTADGVHFTKAGARKAAFFVDRELRRLIDIRMPSSIIALPGTLGEDVLSGKVAPYFELHPPSLPELPGLPVVPVRPAVGAVSMLTRIETAPGGTLVAGRTLPATADNAVAERVFFNGFPPEPVAGRADDFSWPRR